MTFYLTPASSNDGLAASLVNERLFQNANQFLNLLPES